MPQNTHRQILKYIVAAFALPTFVAFEAARELFEFGEEMNLLMTGGKYSGKGSLYNYRENHKQPNEDYWTKFFDWLRPPDYTSYNFRQALKRAGNKQFIEKQVTPDGKTLLHLTKTGKMKAYKQFPFVRLANKPWKGWWTVVSFDIPESRSKTRKSIRKQLLQIGFAQWQKSVYISPHDISDDLSEVIKTNNLQNLIVPMIAKRILSGDDWDFAKSLYNIDNIAADYQEIIKSADIKITPKKFRYLISRYLEILSTDPFLPIGLGPKNGYGRELALSTLKNHANRLKSNLHFGVPIGKL